MKPYFKTDFGKLYHGDALEVLKELPEASIQCVITSPPYWGLRDYGVEGQMGLERTPQEYVDKLVALFREVRRVLEDDGTVWLNLGDSYSGYHANSKMPDDQAPSNKPGYIENMRASSVSIHGLKPKDLVGIPWRVAFALQDDGWWLRQDIIENVEIYCPSCGHTMEERIWRYSQDRDIIWHKPNPMPESVTDRCTKAHEYIFLLSKSERYYYDADALREEPKTGYNYIRGVRLESVPANKSNAHAQKLGGCMDGIMKNNPLGRNKRSVWSINTQPFPEAHFAVFPEKLIEPCILAGSRKGDIILDPFSGAGTTAVMAEKYRRQWVGIELNIAYLAIAKKRIIRETRQLTI